jgi:hypothetical protein
MNQRVVLRTLPLVVGLAAIAVYALSASASPRQDSARLLGAGRDYQMLGRLEMQKRPRSVTYRDAINALGRPSSCRLVNGPASAVATWRAVGVRLDLVTLGGMPRGRTGCNSPGRIQISSASVTGPGWETEDGLSIGDTTADVRSLYPRAIFKGRQRRYGFPAPAYWIVHVRQRCVIGICRSPYETVPRLIARIRNDRVSAFYFPVGAQGE